MGKRDYRFDFFLLCFFTFFAFHLLCNNDMLRINRAQRSFTDFPAFQGHLNGTADIAGILSQLHKRPANARRRNFQGIALPEPVVFVYVLLKVPAEMLALFESYPGIGIHKNFHFVIAAELDFDQETVCEGFFLKFFCEQSFNMFNNHLIISLNVLPGT